MSFEEMPNGNKISEAQFLLKVAAISPEEVEAFKNKLGDIEQDMLEVMPFEEKQIVTAIDALSDEELDLLLAYKKKLIGIHDLNAYLGAIYALTQDSRYQNR
jgi:hypothetical protein